MLSTTWEREDRPRSGWWGEGGLPGPGFIFRDASAGMAVNVNRARRGADLPSSACGMAVRCRYYLA